MIDEGASLQDLLTVAGSPPAGTPAVDDPVALFRSFESTRRFHRDSGLGRVFHPGRVSFRENRPTDSLHVIIHGNHVTAHVDRVSPLKPRSRRPPRYSLRATAAHNLAGMAEDLIQLLRGRQGDHRSQLDCAWQPSRDPPDRADLIDRHSWSVLVEAHVSGTLDEGRLRLAVDTVLGRRPAEGELLWVFDCPGGPAWDSVRTQIQQHPAGMTDWPPLRVALVRGREGDALVLSVNHAASDGVDALRLLGSIATAYATGAGPETPLEFPAVRELPVRPAAAPVSAWERRYRGAVERLRDALARPTPLAPDQPADDPGFGFHLVCLDAEETRPMLAVDGPSTSHNLLLAALHRAIGGWNSEHGTKGRRVGVLVAVDLRPAQWPAGTVGNFSVTARVSTSRRHRSNPSSALKAVTSQTTRNRRTRTGIPLLAALDRSGLLPLWSKQSLVVLQPLTRNRHVDTALLADLGWQDRAPSFGDGAGATTHVWFSPPARGPLVLCVGAVTVSGRLHLTLRYPHRLFSADAARRFADRLVHEIAAISDRSQETAVIGTGRAPRPAGP